MVLRYSPYRSALYGLLALIVASWPTRETPMGIKRTADTLAKGARGAMEIISACAAAGIIIGVLTQTGLGRKFAMVIATGLLGTLALASSILGWLLKEMNAFERVVRMVAALALIKPGWVTDMTGLCSVVAIGIYQKAALSRPKYPMAKGAATP